METTERIVESYFRYVRNWFTISNLKCKGQNEIDLLGVDFSAHRIRRYHVESSVSISGSFSKLTDEPFNAEDLKQPVKKAKLRRSIHYFIERKFTLQTVKDKLAGYGFKPGNYERIIVTWGWTPAAKSVADREKIELLDFRKILGALKSACEKTKFYSTDDTIRTIQLFVRSQADEPKSAEALEI